MSKRPPVDLKALTAEQAAPMPEALQRTAPLSPVGPVKTANLEALAFKVPPDFRKRFRQRAVLRFRRDDPEIGAHFRY